jgi:hypothetical protein
MRNTALSALTVAVALAPLPAAADIGVPMVAVFLPPLWLSLIPIIVVEALIVSRMLTMSLRRSFASVALGNVLSTIVGIPLMWAVLATVEGTFAGGALGLDTTGQKIYAVTVQAPWLIPYDEDLVWMIPVALVVLAAPAYLLSVLVEWRVVSRFISTEQRPRGLRAVALANLASYIALALLFVAVSHASDRFGPLLRLFDGITGWLIDVVYASARFILGAN